MAYDAEGLFTIIVESFLKLWINGGLPHSWVETTALCWSSFIRSFVFPNKTKNKKTKKQLFFSVFVSKTKNEKNG